ncbi:MAG TPA: lytic transglycosylase domain-containing protein [Stellaceae bacterium]|nr:lytic transglycosylase domain-containing protein [Stellaceae bacterium]
MRTRERRSATGLPHAAVLAALLTLPAFAAAAGGRPTATRQLDRVAYAVDGAESSHGQNPAMWRLDPAGPQGPMQVSAKAAVDVGGGNRFDASQNRAIGRAYLAQLYRRYGNWPDAIAAYNWGIGNLDKWIRAGRPADKLVDGVVSYLHRVLRDSGLCDVAALEDCAAQFPAIDTAGGRKAFARARGAPRWGDRIASTRLGRALAQAETMTRQFDAEQSAFGHTLGLGALNQRSLYASR